MNVPVTDAIAGRVHVSADVLLWDARLLRSMGRAYHYGTILSGLLAVDGVVNAAGSPAPRRIALRFLRESCLLRFVVDWCKVFGRKTEKVHWVKLFSSTGVKGTAKVERFERNMARALATYSGVPADAFPPCRESMLRMRDRFAAHLDTTRIPEMPFLPPAYRVADALSVVLSQQKAMAILPLSAREGEDSEALRAVLGAPGGEPAAT